MNNPDRWQTFLSQLTSVQEVTLVGPLAAPRAKWPEPCIFIDGGSRHQGQSPLHISVGDGDSSVEQVDHLLPAAKDFSDLAYVLRHMPQHLSRLSMVGFLGGRRDHELINLGEIHRFLCTRPKPTECDLDWSVCGFSAGKWPLQLKGVFSVVALEPTQLTMTGDCAYPLPVATPLGVLSSHGLSNEGFGIVEIRNDGPVFVFKNPFS